jgi:hypothetical protein
VAGAIAYRVTNTNNARRGEVTIYEGAAATFAVDPGMCTGGMACQYVDRNVSDDHLYSYRVYSVFAGSPPIYSGPGPVASARSAPFEAPANLRTTMQPSTARLGALRVTVTWDAVAGAVGYAVVSGLMPPYGFVYPDTVATPSLVLDGRDSLRPRLQYSICISALYPFHVSKPSVRSCVTVGP